jgi:hypothetical protein
MCEVIEKAKSLRGSEREVVAELVRELSVIYKERLFAEAGYSSLFVFCTDELGYSEGAAWRRTQAAKALLADGSIYERLKTGKLSLCAAAMLEKVIKCENATDIVEQASGKSKRELEVLIAEQLPERCLKRRQETVRVKKVIRSSPSPLFTNSESALKQPVQAAVKSFTVTLEFSEEEMAIIEEAGKILSTHKVKNAVLGSAKNLIASKRRRESARDKRLLKGAANTKVSDGTSLEKRAIDNGRSRPVLHSRYVPADDEHAVEQRDECRCTFVSAEGKRCSETRYLQFDHIIPHALRGESTSKNLRLLCPAHNQLEAEKVFGKAAIRGLIQHKQKARSASSAG